MAEANMNEENTSAAGNSARFYIGQHDSSRNVPVSWQLLDFAHNLDYDMLTTPITTTTFHEKVLETMQEYVAKLGNTQDAHPIPLPVLPLLTPEYTTLSPNDLNTSLIGSVSPWIDLASPDPLIAHISKVIFNLEIGYAAFCGINNILIRGPDNGSCIVQFARAIAEGLAIGPYLQFHIFLPMSGELEIDGGDAVHLAGLARSQYTNYDDDETDVDEFGSWEIWNTIRSMCGYDLRCSVALEIPRLLPSASLQSRWISEPIRLLMFPRTSFLRNAKDFPVLSQAHQYLLSKLASQKFLPWLILCDVGLDEMPSPDPTPAEASKQKPAENTTHLRYLRHLQNSQPSRTPIEIFGQGYQDFLQSPLQPLADNLESITYEVFEKDPVKYEWYERATASALKDLSRKLGPARSEIVVAVVGSGRGPLVTRALQASQSTGVPIQCWAVEKNPNAFVLLQRRNATDPLWNNAVHVVKSDMRYWKGPPDGHVDIMISELLGSFADNELSPECLDGVQHVLHPDHGINIPQQYSALLIPISTPHIHADLLSRPGATSEKWEIPYVVMLHQFDYLSVSSGTTSDERDLSPLIQEAWRFSHPAPAAIIAHAKQRAGGSLDAGGVMGGNGSNEHNSRTSRTTFACTHRGVCHGLAGYFETILYAPQKDEAGDEEKKPVELSTNPITMVDKSKDMISWFPIFFPLKTPLFVPDNSTLEVTMWRQTDDLKVWYEWIVEVSTEFGGKKIKLASSELHSSRKNGCIM